MKLILTYRGVEFTAQQVEALWGVNFDFTARLRATVEGTKDWVYVKDCIITQNILRINS